MRHAERVRLGRRGPEVTRLGFGASAIGGLFAPVSEEDARATLGRAIELGIRYVDTAPLYGLGRSERLVGEVLRAHPDAGVALSTKVGRLLRSDGEGAETIPPGMWHGAGGVVSVLDFSRDGVRRSLEESLERLGCRRVDVAYVHDPDDHLQQAVAEALPALLELRDEGLVGAVGVGMTDAAALARIVVDAPPDCILLAGRFTLLDRSALAELLPLCERREVAVVVGGVLNSGVLARPVAGARYDYVPAAPAVLARAQRLAEVCSAAGVPLLAAALQFPLRHPAVVSVLTGVRSVAELEANVAAFDVHIPDALWDELEEVRA